MEPFKRYAFPICILGYMGAIVLLHAAALFPRADLYDVSRLIGGSQVTFEGRVLDSPVIRWNQTRFLIQGRAWPFGAFHGKAVVTLSFPCAELAPGDQVRLRGWLSAPRAPSFGRDFNERGYWASRGVYALLKVWSPDAFSVQKRSPAWGLGRLAARFRERYRTFWERSLPPDEAALLLGTTIGARGILPQNLKDACIRAGVYHIVVVSGQNMSLIVGLGVSFLLALQVPRRHALWVCTLPIVFYTAAVGGDPPVVRAAVMALVGLLTTALGRDIPRYYPLLLAAAWILIREPEALLGASFQLSFGATASILTLLPLGRKAVARESRWRRFWKEAALMGLVVHIGIWPLLVYYFHRLSFGGFVANWTVFPMSGVVMVLGLAIGTWGVFCPASVPSIVLALARQMTAMMLALIRWMASWRWVWTTTQPPPWTAIGLYYGLLFGILFIFRRRKMHARNPS